MNMGVSIISTGASGMVTDMVRVTDDILSSLMWKKQEPTVQVSGKIESILC